MYIPDSTRVLNFAIQQFAPNRDNINRDRHILIKVSLSVPLLKSAKCTARDFTQVLIPRV